MRNKCILLMLAALILSLPDNNNKTSACLVSGDKVKGIQMSPDNKWTNVGYINVKGFASYILDQS